MATRPSIPPREQGADGGTAERALLLGSSITRKRPWAAHGAKSPRLQLQSTWLEAIGCFDIAACAERRGWLRRLFGSSRPKAKLSLVAAPHNANRCVFPSGGAGDSAKPRTVDIPHPECRLLADISSFPPNVCPGDTNLFRLKRRPSRFLILATTGGDALVMTECSPQCWCGRSSLVPQR